MYTSSVTLNMQNQCATPNFWHSARNFLTGRVVQNWEAKVLIFVVATKVICAAVSLITGQLTFAMVFLLSALFDAILRKKIIDFTNLHNASAKLYDTDIGLKLTKVQLDTRVDRLQKENDRFTKELAELAKEKAEFQASNKNYAHLNNTHHELILAMKEETSFVHVTADQLLRNGTTASKAEVKAFKEHAKKLQELIATALTVQQHQDSGVKSFIIELGKSLKLIDAHGLEAGKQLGELQAETKHLKEEREKWEKERGEFKEEIKRLHDENAELGKRIKELGQVITNATTATGINVQSSITLKNLINSMIYKKEYLPKPGIPKVIDVPTIAVTA